MVFNRQMWSCLLVLIVCLSVLVRTECPEPRNIAPCICGESSPTVVCKNIENLDVLQNILDRSDEPFSNFTLINSNLMFLPSRALNLKNIKEMLIDHSILTTLFEQQPEENHKLVSLTLISSTLLGGVRWKQLQPLKELQNLIVKHTDVHELGKAFEQNISPTLKSFRLNDTNTKKFSPTMFQKLVNLEMIDISNTVLSTLKRSMFPEKNRIETLSFRYNLIKSLPDDLFSNMPYIRRVTLEGNRLKMVSEAVFGRILNASTEYIILEENPISCDCSFKWILYRENRNKVFGTCGNPPYRRGNDFIGLKRDDFAYCPDTDSELFELSI